MLRPSAGETLRAWLLSALVVHGAVAGNPDAKRLYDDLLSNYNKLVRPVVNTSDVLRVCIKLKLSQLIDVLSLQPGIPCGFEDQISIKRKNALEKERDILSLWSTDQTCGTTDTNDVKGGRLLPYTPYIQTYEGVHSALTESFLSKNLGKKLDKISLLQGRGRKSKLISNSLELESTRRKNSQSPHTSKSKRRSSKVNRSESLSNKFKAVDSTREFRKILENFRIISEEDLHESGKEWKESKNIVPAYFVLKLAGDSMRSPVRRGTRVTSSQTFKLVFANDNVENGGMGKIENYNSSVSVKMNDNLNQTIDLDEKRSVQRHPEEPKFKDKETNTEQNDYFVYSKMEREFECQREFNAGLLEQIKNMLAQLATVTGFLGDLLNDKNDNYNIKRNISKKKKSSDELTEFNPGLSDIACYCHLQNDNLYPEDDFNEGCTSVKGSKNDSESIDKDISATFSKGKFNVFYSPQADSNRIRGKQLRRKIESSSLPMKSKCYCHIKHCEKRESDVLKMGRKNGRLSKETVEKALLVQNDNRSKRCAVDGDTHKGRKDLNEEECEDCDYDESSDEMENDCDKVGEEGDMKKLAEAKTPKSFNKMKRLREDQLRLSLDEGDFEFNGNEALYCNDDSAIKLSSRASSRRALVNSTRSQKECKYVTPRKTKFGAVIHNFFSSKKTSKS